MAPRFLRIISITLITMVSFALGSVWTSSNAVYLPQDRLVVQQFRERAATDLAQHFKWSEEGKAAISQRQIIALREAGLNCIVFPTRPRDAGEWSYQACYADEGKLLGVKAF